MYTCHEISEQEHSLWLGSLVGNARVRVFALLLESSVIGVVSLSAINLQHKTADWAFYLDTTLQGKGLGSQVEARMLDYAFGEAGLEKLNCEVLAFNTPVIALHQKFGFTIEGTRHAQIERDGQRLDVVLLGITRGQWHERREALAPLLARLARQA
ncbi:UDP-4-amino-4,6-dideoxy-N-acetyl-beta-L-altrosamine N-acetyltransferase [Pseudomonas sp. KNUC1026]|uniref:UDP-4-amino-4, 6-dideoxy-N-acetyl-beta-L-altrosamine N-acetyltransferase n=1 Tax=Pseudomonas sp. KNUC1026 TaxID=2893890 RepID=UPI001F2468A9|nr:UDP-4-amino-4,6-dideoxy-N-acetyl-beta-L-altrosamine N-acetyltransferase [Pseudomonas sp. KNUC1026]UFH51675.1 UDP-4-amino-4,6-dideoxy-N-acetyl-beta-L-altrosamine N-acetyltransferase [Pseudomonas sp. KNUC1026]